MPRRGENIRKRKDGRWEARYPVFQNEQGGKRYVSVYGRTYREAKAKRQTALEKANPPTRSELDYLFRDILQFWLEDNRIRLKEPELHSALD